MTAALDPNDDDWPLLTGADDVLSTRACLDVKNAVQAGTFGFDSARRTDAEVAFARRYLRALAESSRRRDERARLLETLKRMERGDRRAAAEYLAIVRAAADRTPRDDSTPVFAGLNLRSEERERYEEIRRYRERYGVPKYYGSKKGRKER